jgi:hypothetical protein
MRDSLILAFLLHCFIACNSKNPIKDPKDKLSTKNCISFEVVDSIKINYLGVPNIHDIDPVSKKLVFTDRFESSEQIHIAKFDGSIINSFSKFGDMPDSYGKLMSTIRFLNEESILVYGYKGFSTYDFNGNLLKSQRIVDFQVPDYAPIYMGHGIEKLDEGFLYVNQVVPPDIDLSTMAFLEDFNLLEVLYPDNGERKAFFPFPEKSIYRNGKVFFRNSWDPVYDISDDFIYVVLGLDPIIYILEKKPPYSITSKRNIKFNEFRNFKGSDSFNDDMASFTYRFKSAFIENIKVIDDFFVVAYFPGYDRFDLEESHSNKSSKEREVFQKKIKEKYPLRIAIVDSNGQVISDFVPGNLDPRSMLSRAGELWIMEKQDENYEQDFFRLFKLRLRLEE